MKFNLLVQVIIFLSLIYFIKSLDESTLSNYQTIKLNFLDGIFTPDFSAKIVKGVLHYSFEALEQGEQIVLDSKKLIINSIIDRITRKILKFKFGAEDENLGTPLIIETHNFHPGQIINLTIDYTTTTEGHSAQFLTKDQTFGKQHEYFFTMSEQILGRELIPIQDTPSIKFPFYLGITVPNNLRGMISGLHQKTIENKDGTKTFFYKQDIPVPNYLIGLAAGNIVEEVIDDNISVYSEPEFVQTVKKEVIDFLPKVLNISQEYMGPYEWGKYNLLVLPNSFPYSGMENPCLTFASPCLINGDKSLVDIIAHELIHSWSGNLVTNGNWSDFWLNEGIAMFLQRKIISMWKDKDYAKMDSYLGTFYIKDYLEIFGENSTHTTLRPYLKGLNPDDYYSDIPYEKGFNFMYYLETLIEEENMKLFFQNYFIKFKNQSIFYENFKNFFIEFCQTQGIQDETLNKIEWDKWIYSPGDCPIQNNFSNIHKIEVDKALEKFYNNSIDDNLVSDFSSWIHTSKTIFMYEIELKGELLTEEQHKFFTNSLKLYNESENFLIKTSYFRLILSNTDEFYENEEEYLIKYLSSYGASDYMLGLYGPFYKRDEVTAESTLENLKTFYHQVMLAQAEEEIEKVKTNFPIISIELKKNQCIRAIQNSTMDIEARGYIDSLNEINITKNMTLHFNKFIQLNCTINPKEKYCTIIENPSPGKFYIFHRQRLQKKEYAIKHFEGNVTIKLFTKEMHIDPSTKDIYEIDYSEGEIQNLEIAFMEEIGELEPVQVLNESKPIRCDIKGKIYSCPIKKDEFPYQDDNEGVYELTITDFCGNEQKRIKLQIKQSYTAIYIIISIVSAIIVIAIVVVIVLVILKYRKKKKKDPINLIAEQNLLNLDDK